MCREKIFWQLVFSQSQSRIVRCVKSRLLVLLFTMGRLLRRLRKRFNNDSDDDEDDPVIHDEDAEGLSYVGQAAYEVLKDKHSEHHLRLWNVTSGNMEALDQTPKDVFDQEDYEEGHSDWFPEKLGKMIAQTKVWCTFFVSSLRTLFL